MESVRDIVISLIVLGVILIIRSIYNSDENKAKREAKYNAIEEKTNKFNEQLIENNILDNIKCMVLGYRFTYGLVYTNEDELYLVSAESYMLEKVKFENILDVKVEYSIKEKSKLKVISVVPTFNKHVKLEKCVLKLMLEDKTHEFLFKPGVPSNGCLIKKCITQHSSDVIDSMERMKLLIERKLKNK